MIDTIIIMPPKQRVAASQSSALRNWRGSVPDGGRNSAMPPLAAGPLFSLLLILTFALNLPLHAQRFFPEPPLPAGPEQRGVAPAKPPKPPKPAPTPSPLPTPHPIPPPALPPAPPQEPLEALEPLPPLPQRPARRPTTPVRLQLQGNTHFSEDQIRAAIADQLSEIGESGLSPALADDTAFFLGVFYRKNGYSQASVKWSIGRGNLLILTIYEGPLTTLGKVVFQGNRAIPSGTLFKVLTGFSGEKPPVIPFVESNIRSGTDRIRGYYRSEGYLDVVVEEPAITLSPDKTRANLVITVEEGTQYRFGKIELEGDILFFPHSTLLKELEVFTSKPYTPLAVTNLERKIVYFYRSRGYFMAKARSESDPSRAVNGVVPVKFIVDAGDLYRFDGVTQKYKDESRQRLRPGFLERRFKSLQGQPYDPAKVEERYRMLMSTGLFSNLKLTQTPLPNHEVRLDFEVEEAKARELGFSLGYGSLEGIILGARYVDRNLFGMGRPLNINAEIAQNLLRGEFLYTDPWVLDTNYTLRFRGYLLSQQLNDYSKLESGIHTELSRKIGKNLELSAFVLTRGVQIDNTGGIDPLELGPTRYLVNSLGTSATLDFRDSVLNPTKGLVMNATSDFALAALGSTVDFVRSTARVSYYLPIGKTLLAVGLRGGVILPLHGDHSLPIDERFFNGGSRSVRSYVERSLGPKDKFGHSIGGQTFTTFNIENTFPIYANLKGAVFFDAGSVGRTVSDGIGETGYAVGAGLRYQLPIGPIRVDYGHNPVRKGDQPRGAWHFSFGFAF